MPNALVWPQKTLLPQHFASQCPFERWHPCLDSWEVIKVASLELASHWPSNTATGATGTDIREAHLKLLEPLSGLPLLVYHLLCLCCSLQANTGYHFSGSQPKVLMGQGMLYARLNNSGRGKMAKLEDYAQMASNMGFEGLVVDAVNARFLETYQHSTSTVSVMTCSSYANPT